MGKNGKERKRRKLENALISSFDNKSECSDEDENASDPTTGMKQSELENCTTCLNFVGKNLDIYHSATYKMLRKILFPLIEEQKLKYFEKTFDNECEDHIDAVSFDLTAATKTFSKLSQDIPLFLSPELKALRKALYPLIMDSRESAGLKCSVTLSGQVSLALSSKQWTEAYRYLVDMRKNQIIPKLGALQRWVRQVDDVPDRPLAILLLRAILDVTKPAAAFSALVCDGNTKRGRDECNTLLSGLSDGKEAVKIQHLEPFRFSLSAATSKTDASSSEIAVPLAADFPVVFCIAGKDRRPQSEEDMNIYTSRLGAFRGFSAAAAEGEATNAVRTDIPNVPGAFLLSNVLTAAECNQLMRAAEMLGYSRDAVEGIDAQVWLAQQDVVDAIYSRCRALLPQKNALGHPLVGINKRFRFFRYGAGAVYRPHIDGSWTGGGIDPVTLEYKDNLHVSHHSYMTFLIYLNGDFTGGGTTFFVPDVTASAESTTAAAETTADLLAGATQQDPCGSSGSSGSASAGAIYAQSVVPAQGSILCFPHGTVEGSLIHEGSAVLQGVKYVIRSDVMYDLQG